MPLESDGCPPLFLCRGICAQPQKTHTADPSLLSTPLLPKVHQQHGLQRRAGWPDGNCADTVKVDRVRVCLVWNILFFSSGIFIVLLSVVTYLGGGEERLLALCSAFVAVQGMEPGLQRGTRGGDGGQECTGVLHTEGVGETMEELGGLWPWGEVTEAGG